ncbi:IS4 family transposase [Pseudoalteromonas tetraodonis]|uniref:IS4 family transposase n=1 Tax=Pseudoalteromonas tetraodonis TaxID=43659 RepID=UPI003A97275E
MNTLSKLINQDSIALDKRLLKSLKLSVNTVMQGASVSVTQIGRESADYRGISEKHSIKRNDRLIGNQHLHQSRNAFYKALCTQFITSAHPLIMVDWSSVYNYNFVMIRASLPIQGRAITIYEEVYPLANHTSAKAHQTFLTNLAKCLPDNVKPILCTDAGFKVPWSKEVDAQRWYWVTRVRGSVKYKKEQDSDWANAKSLYQQGTNKPKELGTIQLSKSHAYVCRSLMIKEKNKRRKNLNREGKVTKCHNNKRHSKSAREPWLLTTNLPTAFWSALDVVNIYRKRMTIEETFRDNKNEHYGLGLSRNRSVNIHRIENLLLVAALAQIALYIIGKIAENKGVQRHYQANTIKTRRVLSYGYLALRVLQSRTMRISPKDIQIAIEELSNETS